MTRLRLAAAAAILLALASCTSAVQSRLFLPEPMPASITWSGRAPDEVTATTADGLKLRGYYWPPQSVGGDLILFFHGNGGNRYTAARRAAPLADGGGLLVASYRGYGDNPGEPDEAGLYADARAFLALARTLAPNSRIYLLGYSLGAAPALHTAAEEEVAGVVTLGAFARLADVGPKMARGVLRGHFDNTAAIARVDEPILLLHAPADEVVPFAQAYALRDRAPHGVRLLRLEGAGHGADFEFLSKMIWENIRQMPGRGAPAVSSNDHEVYTAVLRTHFMKPEHGEHGLLCGPEEPVEPLTIVETTQPLPPGTLRRDLGWADYLPAKAAPLMAALRALDSQPRRRLEGDKLAVGVPIHLVSDSNPPNTIGPPLYWFSRVAYTDEGEWALVYAAQVCPGITEADAENAEPGGYVRTILAALQRRDGKWIALDPLYLDVGIPRVAPAGK